ncbi:helix-turn-helix transcriptional regulator [Marimonas lutisalis]|uniref:helix-turn-helix transcriptional regulator n=1 Tax=Marimonas lutisalis TaxID=2545756 RepID=UPI0010F819FE|nr:helix-turn-helix transcriptional regulator [Marimonas lutisalis]
MPKTSLTGSRIRERRVLQGLKQSELAGRVGVSPSYLNLIEHNRRRIGGKLLVDIAAVLDVEPSLLAEGAEAALIARLRHAAAEAGEEGAEVEAVEDFAGRYPGWARLVAAQRQQVAGLQRSVETLTDRLTHDPHLAQTLHEVLDTVTAIRSTASILAETREIEPEWRDRFHRNINEDAQRLAEGAQALVGFLDGASDAGRSVRSPQEEVDTFLESRQFHFPDLEAGSARPEDIIAAADDLESASAAAQALRILERYLDDAEALSLETLRGAVERTGPDPMAIAAQIGIDPGHAMRRLAALPELEAGLVICDASGTLTFRKPVEGFALPRFAAACPLWPLFRALSRPMVPVIERVGQLGRGAGQTDEQAFTAYAVALPKDAAAWAADPLYEGHMLLLPSSGQAEELRQVGASCRICPRADCSARREPSIMADGF